MSGLVWCWEKGNKKFYTRRLDIAEQAMNDGFIVIILKDSPRIFRN